MPASTMPPGLGPHAEFIRDKMPAWIKHSLPDDIKRLRAGGCPEHQTQDQATYDNAPLGLREALNRSMARSRAANVALARTLKGLEGISAFAEPRLKAALLSHRGTGREMDVNKDCLFYLRRDQPVQVQSLLQAALLNFEGNETFSVRVNGQFSALAPAGALPVAPRKPRSWFSYALIADPLVHGSGYFVDKVEDEVKNSTSPSGFSYSETLEMQPWTFSNVCRTLDLGRQYQEHLSAHFDAPTKAPRVRRQMAQAQKELLTVRMHTALMKRDISAHTHQMLSAILDGQPHPRFYNKPVVFSQLSLFGFVLADVLLIGPYRSTLPVTELAQTGLGFELPVFKKPDPEPLLVYLPGATLHPLKEYKSLEDFEHELANDLLKPHDQQLFSTWVHQGDAQAFLQRLNNQLYLKGSGPDDAHARINTDDVSLRISQTYIQTSPAELFHVLTDLHIERLKANARVLAVPTADADSKLLQERLDYYLGLGMDVVNVAAFFIPGVGEIMMAVMALQIAMEIYHGLESFSVGDMDGAWSHLESVAINVAMGAGIAGAGYGISKIPAEWIAKVKSIVLPGGEIRLWKPDMVPYQADATFDPQVQPNALGQYVVDGKTWVQIDQHFYEQTLDAKTNTWRVKHPNDSEAYEPVLEHNHEGAWRFAHERPLEWERPVLLRRLGPVTRMFDDQMLTHIGDVSDVSDAVLRKMHVDDLPVPARLADMLDWFAENPKVDIFQVKSSDPDLALLRRRFTPLSEREAQEVLGLASAREVASLRTGRVPRRLDDVARSYAQQGRLNRALAGLFVPDLVSADSQRLLAYLTEHVPGNTKGEAAQQAKALGAYATSHRTEMARALNMRVPRSRPYLRRENGRLGYALSGGGSTFAFDESLVSRLRDVYPNITDEQAILYVSRRLREGDTEQQVFHFLANQQREFQALRAALEPWVNAAGRDFDLRNRGLVRDRLMRCWREGVLDNEQPHADLDLADIKDLPPMEADFSHVRSIRMEASMLLGESGAALITRFPGVERFELNLEPRDMMQVVERLNTLPGVKELSFVTAGEPYSPNFLHRLTAMTQLERLTLVGPMGTLDVSNLLRLIELKVSMSVMEWPTGVLALEHLQGLDLQGCVLRELPDAMFSGHERLWRGLRLDWSHMDSQTVIKAYDYLSESSAHLADMERWVSNYCDKSLRNLLPQHFGFAEELMAQVRLQGEAPRDLLVRIAGLKQEQRILNEGISTWLEAAEVPDTYSFRVQLVGKLKSAWHTGLLRRLGVDQEIAGSSWRSEPAGQTLNLSGSTLIDLPNLPRTGFEHVQHLNMYGLRVSSESLNRFLGSFTQVRELNLSANNITHYLPEMGNFTQLRELNLSYNDLRFTPSALERLNRLSQLQKLNLRGNRVGALDVSSMRQLEELDLANTGITEWPRGVLELAHLRELDLSRSAITVVPEAALSGHDALMANTRLNGCALTPASCSSLLNYAKRTRSISAGWIPRGLLIEGKTGGIPEFFPAEVSDQPDLLLPAPLDLAPSDALLTPAARLQRIDPGLGLQEAIDRVDQWLTQGHSALEIDARLEGWQRQHSATIQQLNRWIDIQSYRDEGRWISSMDRRRAADRLVLAWRRSLGAVATSGAEDLDALNFSDLCLGDLPALPLSLEHVTQLNLSGVRLTEDGANDFLRSFPRLRDLQLNNNALSRLPEAVDSLDALTRLEVSHNRLRNSAELQRQLRPLQHLEWLDLSMNTLDSLDVTGLNQLRTLNVSGNRLVRWPVAVLDLPELSALDLSNNQIEDVSISILELNHNRLMAGTDITDNYLDRNALEVLRDYEAETGIGLGYTRTEIESQLSEFDDIDDSSETERDEDLETGDNESGQVQKDRWFKDVPDDADKHAIWEELYSREGSEGLFHLLSELKVTRDFIEEKEQLTARVWDVLRAAYENRELCADLFIRARSHYTCGDGRILLFSDLEVKVYEFNALKDIAPGAKSRVLLNLSRSLFRLGKLEEIAQDVIKLRPRSDPAEIRLVYRVSLAQRLGLPRQPKDMLYRNIAKVTPEAIERAYLEVIAAEDTPAFMEQLLGREYWVDFLTSQYPGDFLALEQRQQSEIEALEARFTAIDDAYSKAVDALGKKNAAELKQLLTQLTERERSQVADN